MKALCEGGPAHGQEIADSDALTVYVQAEFRTEGRYSAAVKEFRDGELVARRVPA